MLIRYLRDMNQTINAIFQLNKCAEGGNLGYITLNNLTDCKTGCNCIPRIITGLFQTKADTLITRINLKHNSINLLALLQNLARMVNLTCP